MLNKPNTSTCNVHCTDTGKESCIYELDFYVCHLDFTSALPG